MTFAQEPIFQWLAQYAYEPNMVYLGIIGMMLASGFGLPIPEEVTIVSVGLMTYMGAHPEHFPPPYPGAPVINGYEAAAVTFIAVVAADIMIFSLGRFFGRKLMRKQWFKSLLPESAGGKVSAWMHKYGVYAAFLFRFTPGLRFPAHVAMGMSPLPLWQFAMVDGFAALLSVPTQILLIYHYGEPILHAIQKFKYVIFALIGIAIIVLIAQKLVKKARQNGQAASEEG